MTTTSALISDWVTLDDLYRDPFPIYARLRREAPVSWVPVANRYLVTRYEDCHNVELDQETFSANETDSLMKVVMGHNMLRKDDPEHDVERKAWQPTLRPRAIKDHWQSVFEENTEKYLNELAEHGPGADLIPTFAAPLAAENLRRILGFENATQQDLQRWSQDLIDGTGNYGDNADVWARANRSAEELDTALDEMIVHFKAQPNHSMISGLVNATGYEMPVELIRSNMKMTIGGGINEPRDVIGTAVVGLLQNPDQLTQVLHDPSLWHVVFDETVRWVAPIGMYPRQSTREVELGGVIIPAGSKLGICLLSANRDEAQFADADKFDINREKRPHLAFGGGAHFCAGAWVAKGSISGVALPRLFARFSGLKLDQSRPVKVGGWVFRGPLDVPITWERDERK